MFESGAEPSLLGSVARLGMVLGNTGFDFTGVPGCGPSDADVCACFRKFTHEPILHAGFAFGAATEWRDVFVVELELDNLCRLHEEAGTLDWKYEVTLALYDKRTSLVGFLPTIRLPNDGRLYVHGSHVHQIVDHLAGNPAALWRVLAAKVQGFPRPPRAGFSVDHPDRPTTVEDVSRALGAFPDYADRVLRELTRHFGRPIEEVPPLKSDECVARQLRVPVSLRCGWLVPAAGIEYAAAIAGVVAGEFEGLPRVNVLLSGLDRSMQGSAWSTFVNVAFNSLPPRWDDSVALKAREEGASTVSVLQAVLSDAMDKRLDRHNFVYLGREAVQMRR